MEATKTWIVDMFNAHVEMFSTDTTVAVLSVVSLLLFLLLVPFGSKFMTKGFSAVLLFEAICYVLFPEQIYKLAYLSTMVPDVLHLQEIRAVGAVLIAVSATYFLTSKSTDSTVHSSILWTYTLMLGTMLLLEVNVMMKPLPHVNMNMQQLIIHNLVLWFAAFLYYSVRQPDWGGFAEVASSRNFHLRLDFLLWFVPGVAAFVFPQKVYSFQVVSTMNLDATHAHMARSLAVVFLTLAITSGRASNFLREDDKKSVLLSHVLATFLLLVTMALCQILTTTFTYWHLTFGITTVFFTFVNALLGCEPKNLANCARQQLTKLIPMKQD